MTTFKLLNPSNLNDLWTLNELTGRSKYWNGVLILIRLLLNRCRFRPTSYRFIRVSFIILKYLYNYLVEYKIMKQIRVISNIQLYSNGNFFRTTKNVIIRWVQIKLLFNWKQQETNNIIYQQFIHGYSKHPSITSVSMSK